MSAPAAPLEPAPEPAAPCFPLIDLPPPILQRVARSLERWDLAAARAACSALRATANAHAQRLVITPHSLAAEQPQSYTSSIKTRPTDLHLFPSIRSLTLVPSAVLPGQYPPYGYGRAAFMATQPGAAPRGDPSTAPQTHHLSAPAAFAPPAPPAAAAAARRALAGVARLEVAWRGPGEHPHLDPSRLAGALAYLPGLRSVVLRVTCEITTEDDDGALVMAALAACPGLESLDWDVEKDFQLLPAQLPRLTELRSHIQAESIAKLAGLTRLRRLALTLQPTGDWGNWGAVEGLPALTNLESLELRGDDFVSFKASDLAPLSALTRLCLQSASARGLPSCPAAGRLLRLELRDFGGEEPPAPLLAALARGAPCLERMRIAFYLESSCGEPFPFGFDAWNDASKEEQLGGLLGADITWPRLTHLQVGSWAAVVMAGCIFPRLLHLCLGLGNGWDEEVLSAACELAAKARERVLLGAKLRHTDTSALSGFTLFTRGDFDPIVGCAARIPRLSGLSLEACGAWGSWEPLAGGGLTSIHLYGHPTSDVCCGLSLLTRLESLALTPTPFTNGFGNPVAPAPRPPLAIAESLAALPRLTHLRFGLDDWEEGLAPPDLQQAARERSALPPPPPPPDAAALLLARCPRLRVLEVGREGSPLWSHVWRQEHRWMNECDRTVCVPRASPAWAALSAAFAARRGVAIRPGPGLGAAFSSAAADNALCFEV
ncbi:MAG: hypothetical protein J3K34DRAFT_516200 [Monoraphidium minutum]|nr:MAG: hypothetical protein J3K34DRAFT_516200 [Monoraphidium minutum]